MFTDETLATNRLYRGEVDDFEHACDLVVQATRDEKQAIADLNRRYGKTPDQADADYFRSLDEYADQARQAQSIYRAVLASVRAETIRRLEEASLDQFAAALRDRDWSKLAI